MEQFNATSQRKSVAIIGVGLIGGSLAIRLHEKKLVSRIVGVEASELHGRQALELELVDAILPLEQAVQESDVIFLAVPMDQLQLLLPRVLDLVDRQIVVDLGSTKSGLIERVRGHAKRGRYVATHPMWGTEYNGPSAARADAFENRAVIICDQDDSEADAVSWVRMAYRKIGMRILEMGAQAHDVHAAYVSHISHITSFALANTVLEKEKADQAIFEMASAGFASTVRLAKSSPAMWTPIFLQNRGNVLDVLKEHIAQLQRFQQSIENEDEDHLRELMENANRINRIIE